MMSVAALSSAIRTAPMSARTSGVSMAGLRMSPSSPPVAVTNTVCTPSAWYLATCGAPAAGATAPPLGFMLDTHGRHVAALPRHLPFEGQQGPGQDGGPPRHA